MSHTIQRTEGRCGPRFFGYRKTIAGARKQKIGPLAEKEVDIWLLRWAKLFMANTSIISSARSLSTSRLMAASLAGNRPVAERFLSPLANILGELTTTRVCPELPDADWLALGVLRVLHDSPSGRGFLQEVGPGLPGCPEFTSCGISMSMRVMATGMAHSLPRSRYANPLFLHHQ
jgi:hypothetical protein